MAAQDKGDHLLYYYQGNFYMPLTLHGGDLARVKKAIRIFSRENKQLIASDRGHDDYQTTLEIFDELFT